MRKIKTNYDDFILESRLELLFEANIKFSEEFSKLLNNIESPIATNLFNLQGKEVDVNRNYMTYNIEKNDSVVFYPDDKAEKTEFIVENRDGYHYNLSSTLYNYSCPNIGQKVNIIKELTYEDLMKIYKDSLPGWRTIEEEFPKKIVHISFTYDNEVNECFFVKECLKRDLKGLKPSEMKIGRFISNFFKQANINFSLIELNDFIDKYKSELKQLKDKFDRFEIVKGDDIKYWYDEDNYLNGSGNLGSSCMRHNSCQDYFDLYTDNDSVSLIILKSTVDPNKIIGRALLWDVKLGSKDIKFMDRIYISDHSDESFFINFARNNNFYYKESQDYSDIPIVFDGQILDSNDSYMELEIGEVYKKYPYMDTMKYYYKDSGILSNKDQNYDFKLTDTEGGNGSCENCGGTGTRQCPTCEGDETISCENCYSGNVTCHNCEGEGTIECYSCEGEGEVYCNECDGDGEVDCSECYGDDENCSFCDGSGKIDCDECNNGKKECNDCKGDGSKKCDECYGTGDVDCEECDGSGETECYRCEGSGNIDCDECNN